MGRNKALLRINGVSLIENLIRQIEPLFSEIIICASKPDPYARLRRRIALDSRPGCGPLMGILSGLRASATEANFVFPCDVPRVERGFLRRMMTLAHGREIVVPRYRSGKFEPLLAIYKKSLIPAIERQIAAGSMKIADLFSAGRTEFVPMDGETWYFNLNTAQELAAFQKSEEGRDFPAAGRRR